MADEKDNDLPKLRDMIGYFVLRITDSGLAPWALVALFLLGGVWIITRKLDSKDTLTLISKFGTFHGMLWAGWILAFIEIPIARWMIVRTKRLQSNRITHLQEENKKARDMLKKYTVDELKLEQ
jgi:hypothetical protein